MNRLIVFLNNLPIARKLFLASVIPVLAVVALSTLTYRSVATDNTVKLVPVKTGIDDGLWVEILDGLTGEEDVVAVGKGGLVDGHAVQATA